MSARHYRTWGDLTDVGLDHREYAVLLSGWWDIEDTEFAQVEDWQTRLRPRWGAVWSDWVGDAHEHARPWLDPEAIKLAESLPQGVQEELRQEALALDPVEHREYVQSAKDRANEIARIKARRKRERVKAMQERRIAHDQALRLNWVVRLEDVHDEVGWADDYVRRHSTEPWHWYWGGRAKRPRFHVRDTGGLGRSLQLVQLTWLLEHGEVAGWQDLRSWCDEPGCIAPMHHQSLLQL